MLMSADTQLAIQTERPSQALDLFDPTRYAHAMVVAKQFAQSGLVPVAFRKNDANCFLAIEIAGRMGASPFMVMQNLNIIHEKPSWSSQFIIAMINASGRFTPLRFTYTGTKGNDDRTCVAWATSRVDGERLEGAEVSIKIAKAQGWWQKTGSKWPDMSELMLMYRAATFFGRMYAPDMLMGMQTQEEVWDVDPKATPDVVDPTPTLVPAASSQETPKKSRGTGVSGMKVAEKVTEQPPVAEKTVVPPVVEPKKETPAPVQDQKPEGKPATPAPTEEAQDEIDMGPATQGDLVEILKIEVTKANTARGFVLKIDLHGENLACSGFFDGEEKDIPKVGQKAYAKIERKQNPTTQAWRNIITSLVAA